MHPTKRIVSQAHLQQFLSSETHTALTEFIVELNASVQGLSLSHDVVISPTVEAILSILKRVEQMARDTPPVENGKSRFGNPAFRTFYDLVAAEAGNLLESLPELKGENVEELSGYFQECWGNRTRVDYGSGMELNFICWLLCLQKLGLIKTEDNPAIVLRVFWSYMGICRLLQTTYWLEPAGSHGAQGLDDYHFAVFIFGSSQLTDHKYLKPKSIHDKEMLEEFSKDYMYFEYINFINSIKSASIRWHSPMLDDISAVKTWSKVNSGMLKMYNAEVLAKLPVAQHILFGQLLPYPPSDSSHAHEDEITLTDGPGRTGEKGVTRDHEGHLHVRGEGFGDCCGIKVPSAFAAAAEEEEQRRRKNGVVTAESKGVKRIPFD